jgi:hypothetical protein
MTDSDTKDIAREAGREAAREMMMLGIDVSTPEGVQKAQRNWAFLDDLHDVVRAVRHKTFMTIIGLRP